MLYPDYRLQNFLDSRQDWILEKLKLLETTAVLRKTYTFVSGSSLPFLGGSLVLQIISGRGPSYLLGEKLVVPVRDLNNLKQIKKSISQWYAEQALAVFQQRVDFFAEKLAVRVKSISVRDYKSRWGACKRTGEITFCWRLLLGSKDILDYVVVHELCHLIEFNHSPAFYKKVASVLPNYKGASHALKVASKTGELEI